MRTCNVLITLLIISVISPITQISPVNAQANHSSELTITEIGPFRNSVQSFISPDGTEYPVVFLEESFHIDASFSQFDNQDLEEKCLNIYLDRDENPTPIATIQTDENGMIEWFSGDSMHNPSLKGIEITNGKLEGLRTLRVSYEPEQNVTGGCDGDPFSQTNGSYSEIEILVQSRVDFGVVKSWIHIGENIQYEGSQITGEVRLFRDRMDLPIENEEITFSRQYFVPNNGNWIIDYENVSVTNESGIAKFNWTFDGKNCPDVPCSGIWRVVAYYPGSFFFAPPQNNISFEVHTKDSVDSDGDGVFDHLDAFPQDANETHDDDGDGVGNNSDVFPQDKNETMDSDGDGVGDNSDADPNDPNIRIPADIEINVTDRSLYVLSAAILIFAAVLLFARRKPPSTSPSPFVTEDDSIWND